MVSGPSDLLGCRVGAGPLRLPRPLRPVRVEPGRVPCSPVAWGRRGRRSAHLPELPGALRGTTRRCVRRRTRSCTSVRCRSWSTARSSRSPSRRWSPRDERTLAGCRWRRCDGSREHPAGVRAGRALRDVRPADRRGAPARRRPRDPHAHVHLPRAATCCSATSTPPCATAPSPTATSRSRTSSSTPATWDELQIPVSLAFVFRNSVQERVVAFYPSPAGCHRVRAASGGLGAPARGQPGARPAAAGRRGPADLPDRPRARASSAACWCRSTSATSWWALCAPRGAGSTAARRPGPRWRSSSPGPRHEPVPPSGSGRRA